MKAVIGLGFGDEGKGCIVNHLCSQSPTAAVIRFSGGQQAGHTIVHNDVRHVFSNFGSGTLQNIPTYWSEFCTIDPMGIYNEYQLLKKKGITPKLYIHGKCPVTTPFDKIANQSGKYTKNGTVGVGYGTTLQRENNYYSLLYEDTFYKSVLEEKYRLIQNYYKFNNMSCFKEYIKFLHENCEMFYDYNFPDNIIFEGSQGLLLDQNYGFFPNVTRGNTGTQNLLEIRKKSHNILAPFEFYLITRAYQTRHGNGFMTNENIPHNIRLNPKETNVDHPYQGKFRISLLDLDLLKYAISKDRVLRKKLYPNKLVITCLNAVKNDYRFTYQQEIISCKNQIDFIRKIKDILL